MSAVTFWPATSLVRAGAKKPVEKEQLFRLPQHLRSQHPWKRFYRHWKEEFAAHGQDASLFRALRKTFLGEWCVILRQVLVPNDCTNRISRRIICMILQFIYTATQFCAPVLLPYLLRFIGEGVAPIGFRPTPDWYAVVAQSVRTNCHSLRSPFRYSQAWICLFHCHRRCYCYRCSFLLSCLTAGLGSWYSLEDCDDPTRLPQGYLCRPKQGKDWRKRNVCFLLVVIVPPPLG